MSDATHAFVAALKEETRRKLAQKQKEYDEYAAMRAQKRLAEAEEAMQRQQKLDAAQARIRATDAMMAEFEKQRTHLRLSASPAQSQTQHYNLDVDVIPEASPPAEVRAPVATREVRGVDGFTEREREREREREESAVG